MYLLLGDNIDIHKVQSILSGGENMRPLSACKCPTTTAKTSINTLS